MQKGPDFWRDYDKRFETFKLDVLLKQARIDAGMTQEQIAQQLKTSKSVISRMENHATDIHSSTREKFAKAVGSDIHVALDLIRSYTHIITISRWYYFKG